VDVPSARICKLARAKPVERNIAPAAKRKNVVRLAQQQKQKLLQIQQRQQNKQRQTKIEIVGWIRRVFQRRNPPSNLFNAKNTGIEYKYLVDYGAEKRA